VKIDNVTFNSQEWTLAGSAKPKRLGKFRAIGPVKGGRVAKPPAPRGTELFVAGLQELARVAAAPPPAPKPAPTENATAAFIREVRYARGRKGAAELAKIGSRAIGEGVDPHLVRSLSCKRPTSDIARRAEQRLVYSITNDIDLAATFGRPEER